jgi:4-amino-4-deoxy-L-arabinose transferase-like glycosyltransferase
VDDAGGSTAHVVRRARLLLAAILVCGLALRLAHLFALRGDILFDHPQLDEELYVDGGHKLAAGAVFDARPYWQPPGLMYALCVIFRFAGRGLLAPRIVQALVGTACAWLVFALARRWFSLRVALAAAFIVAVHGVLIFETGELLPATWIAFFDLVMLLLFVRATETPRVPWALGAGIALGVSALLAPTILPFGVVAAFCLWRARRGFALVGAMVAGVVLVIAPVTLRNHHYGGEWVLVSTNGGINLYIGNNADYPNTVAIRPGRHWTTLWGEPDRNGVGQPGAASSYFTHKALRFMAAHPFAEAGLFARKLYLFLNGSEIPRDTDLYGARAGSPVLRALVWPGPLHFPDGLMIPLALVGIGLSWRRRSELALPLGFVLTLAVVTAAFFVTSRHRVPVLPVLAIFAAFGAAELFTRRNAVALGALAALVVVLNLPVREAKASYAAELDFYRGLAYLHGGHDTVHAVQYLRHATAADPNDERFWFELGNTLEATGHYPEAIDAWGRSAALDPTDPRPGQRIEYWRSRLH